MIAELQKLHPNEEWKVIPEFPQYAVSSAGKVASFKRGTIRLMKIMTMTNEYNYQSAYVCLEKKTRRVARLMASAFWNLEPKMVLHINGNPFDNRLENLKPGDARENYRDSELHGTAPKGSRQGISKLTEDDVRLIRAKGKIGREGIAGSGNIQTLAKEFRVAESTIRSIIHKETWSHLND